MEEECNGVGISSSGFALLMSRRCIAYTTQKCRNTSRKYWQNETYMQDSIRRYNLGEKDVLNNVIDQGHQTN